MFPCPSAFGQMPLGASLFWTDLNSSPALGSRCFSHITLVRSEPLRSQHRPDLNQSCYTSLKVARGGQPQKELHTTLADSLLLPKALHAQHVAVWSSSCKEIFPNCHDLASPFSFQILAVFNFFPYEISPKTLGSYTVILLLNI